MKVGSVFNDDWTAKSERGQLPPAPQAQGETKNVVIPGRATQTETGNPVNRLVAYVITLQPDQWVIIRF